MKNKACFLFATFFLFLFSCQKPGDPLTPAPPVVPPVTPPVTPPVVPPVTSNQAFNKLFGGSSEDYAISITASAGGGFVIAGRTESNDGDVSGNHGSSGSIDGWIIKLDSTGKKLWQKTIGGSKDDITYNIKATPDGGYVIAGNTDSNDGDVVRRHDKTEGWVVKLDSAGRIMWQRTLGGSADDLLHCIVVNGDGTYAVAGFTSSNDGDVTGLHGAADAWVAKLDASGNIIWMKALGGLAFDAVYSIVGSPDGGYAIAGGTFSNDGDVSGNHGAVDAWVAKLDRNGNKVWQKALGGSENDEARAIIASRDGGYVVTGYTRSNDKNVTGQHGRSDAWVVKLDESGNMQWQKALGGTNDDDAFDVVEASDGGYLIAANTYSGDGDVVGKVGSLNGWIVKLASSGNKLWQKVPSENVADRLHTLIRNGSDYVAAGSSFGYIGNAGGNWNAWITTIKNQ